MKITVCAVPGCVIIKLVPVETGHLSRCQSHIHQASRTGSMVHCLQLSFLGLDLATKDTFVKVEGGKLFKLPVKYVLVASIHELKPL